MRAASSRGIVDASSNATAMTPTTSSPRSIGPRGHGRSSIAGRMHGGGSSSAWKKTVLQSPRRRCARSPSSMPSRKRFADPRRKRGSPRGRNSPHRSSRPSAPGLKHNSRASRRSSKLAEDIRYTLAHWSGLTRFLEDGRLELDTNPVENQIRKIALTRKNALFAGHEVGAQNWALLASLIANCKMADVDPVRYLTDTLRALLDGHPKNRIDELMPRSFADASSRAA